MRDPFNSYPARKTGYRRGLIPGAGALLALVGIWLVFMVGVQVGIVHGRQLERQEFPCGGIAP